MRSDDLERALDEVRTWPPCDFGCCHFVGHVAYALTGIDRRAMFPAYSSQAEADALIKQHGGLVGILTKAFGDPIRVQRANRGDPVLAEVDGELIAGICIGARIAVRCKSGGLTFPSMRAARLAWRVQ